MTFVCLCPQAQGNTPRRKPICRPPPEPSPPKPGSQTSTAGSLRALSRGPWTKKSGPAVLWRVSGLKFHWRPFVIRRAGTQSGRWGWGEADAATLTRLRPKTRPFKPRILRGQDWHGNEGGGDTGQTVGFPLAILFLGSPGAGNQSFM